MATKIDKRIVEMELRNRQFEAGAAKTLSTLDRLKEKLNFRGIGSGLEGVNKSVRRMDFNPMVSGVDAVITKFNALGVMGASVIQNLTNKAVNFGIQFGKQQLVAPVKDGLGEYETKIGAIQTILTNTKSKGTTLDQVIDTLDELNLYADKTIYNFAEMTRNIGTFTAAGVDLDKAAISIKGIANLAAGSGSTSQQAATAMYQLSQALSSGTVKLQDWNSVVNAGMGGELFQTALKKNAKALGIFVDETKPFRETLQDGWLTSDVLVKTLEEFANDETLTDAATKVKTFTQLLDTLKEAKGSGWAKTWELIIGDFEEAKNLWTAVSDALGSIIEKQAEARNQKVTDWVNAGGRDKLLGALGTAWKNINLVLTEIGKAWKSVFPPSGKNILIELTNGFVKMVDFLTPTAEGLAKIRDIAKNAFKVLAVGVGWLKTLGTSLVDIVNKGKAGEGIFNILAGFGNMVIEMIRTVDVVEVLKEALVTLGATIENLWTTVSTFDFKGGFKKALDFFTNIPKQIEQILSGITDIERKALIGGATAGGLGLMLKPIFDMIRNKGSFGDSAKSAVESLGDMFENIGDSFKNFSKAIKANQMLNIAKSIALIAGSLFLLAMLPSDKLLAGTLAIGAIFGALTASVKILGGLGEIGEDAQKGQSMFGIAAALLAIAGAVAILTASAMILSFLDLPKALGSLTYLMVALVGSVKILDKASSNILKVGAGMILMSIAFALLTAAMLPLALIPVEMLMKGLLAFSLLMTLLGFLTAVLENANILKTSVGILVLSVAINIMVVAILGLSLIPFPLLIIGITALGIVLLQLAVAVRIIQKSLVGAGALIGLAIALNLLVVPIAILGSMNMDTLIQGLLAVTVVLGILVAASMLLTTAVAGAGALVALSVALIVLASAVWVMAQVPTENLWQAVGAVAALFGILLVSAAVAIALSPGLIMLSVAIIAIGVAVLIAGAGIWLFATAMGAFAVTGAAGFAVLAAGLIALSSIIPYVVKQILVGFKMVVDFVKDNAPEISDSIAAMLGAVVAAIPVSLFKATEYIIQGFINLCGEIERQAGPLADAVVGALQAVVAAVEDHWDEITDSMGRLMTGLLGGISQAIRDYGPQILYDMEYISGFIAEGLVRGLGAAIPNTIASVRDLGADIIGAMTGDYQNAFTAGYKSLIGYKDGATKAKKETFEAVGKTLDMSTKEIGPSATTVPLSPILDMKQPHLELDKFKQALTQTHKDAAKMEGTINTHQIMEVIVSGGAPVIVKGAGDQQTFNKVVGTLGIENEITNMLRRQNRR